MPTNRIYITGVGAIAGSHIQTVDRLPNSENIEIHVKLMNLKSDPPQKKNGKKIIP